MPNEAIVFTSPIPKPIVFVSPIQPKQEPKPCEHLDYDLDPEDGYTCNGCGIQLVFCWACMNAAIHKHANKPHVHEYPPCDDHAERAFDKPSGKGRIFSTGGYG